MLEPQVFSSTIFESLPC